MNQDCLGKGLIFPVRFIELLGKRVRQTIIPGGHRLVIILNAPASEGIKNGIQVNLPVIHRLEFTQDLRGRFLL